MAQRHDDHRSCGPECPYRGLYEGSQASLADMARRQADALRRVGRFRNALVLTLKRHFPDKFARAESGLGGRLSDADDEVLLAYLAAFLGASPLDNQLQASAGLHELRSALAARGIVVHGDDLAGWAQQIKAQPPSVSVTGPSPSPTGASPKQPLGAVIPAMPLPANASALAPVQPEVDRPEATPKSELDAGTGLADLFGDRPNQLPQSLGDLFETPVSPQGATGGGVGSPVPTPLLGDLFLNPPTAGLHHDQAGRWSPSPLIPRNEHRPGTRPDEPAPDPFNDMSSSSDSWGDDGYPAEDPSIDGYAGAVPAGSGSTEDSLADDPGSGRSADDSIEVSAAESAGSATNSAFDEPESAQGWLDPHEQTNASMKGQSARYPVFPSRDEGIDLLENNTAGGDEPPRTAPTPVAPVMPPAGGPGYELPLRPELFTAPKPAKTTRRAQRNVRQRAERPDPTLLDIPVDQGPVREIPEEVRDRLTDAALLPRPMFTSDLVAIAGNAEAVSTWESDLRAEPANSPVRFLAAKGRHRLRGSLVVPVQRNAQEKGTRPNWWADCVERYRGSRLYELGVLLHRIGDEVVSAQFDDHGALLRLNSARGIVGVAVVFENVQSDPSAAGAVENMLSQLLGERCSLVAVLTTSGENTAVTCLGDAIGRLAVSKGWRAQFPVITARSWEFADDRGSTAQLVLGG